MAHNDAHNALVRDALQELAIQGYKAWESETGVWFEKNEKGEKGRAHKFGKKGGGDITIILPRALTLYEFADGPHSPATHIKNIIIGQHVEAEAKTGAGKQNDNQQKHQKFLVEPAGGIYILFRTVEELLCHLKDIK